MPQFSQAPNLALVASVPTASDCHRFCSTPGLVARDHGAGSLRPGTGSLRKGNTSQLGQIGSPCSHGTCEPNHPGESGRSRRSD